MNKDTQLSVTDDLKPLLSVLKQNDADTLLALKEELKDNWNKNQIFRTETEMRISVLNDAYHPTKASKYWQSVREMSAHFNALINLSFDIRRTEVERLRLERKLEEVKASGDPLDIVEVEIDLDENLYTKAHQEQTAQDRVRELKTWSKIKAELNDGSFDDQNSNTHQAISLKATLENRLATLSNTSELSEILNVVGPLQTVDRLITENGGLLTFEEARAQLVSGSNENQ
jgi:hypothetical protein